MDGGDVNESLFTYRFCRTRQKIHRPTCRYTANAIPWRWAEDKDVEEWLRLAWLKPCRTCLPDLAARQERIREAGDLVTDELAYYDGEA